MCVSDGPHVPRGYFAQTLQGVVGTRWLAGSADIVPGRSVPVYKSVLTDRPHVVRGYSCHVGQFAIAAWQGRVDHRPRRAIVVHGEGQTASIGKVAHRPD